MFKNIKIGISPIGWTNDDDPCMGGDISFMQCIQEMRDADFVGCELGTQFPKNSEAILSSLSPLGLQIAGSWFSTYFTIDKIQNTIDAFKQHIQFLKSLSADVIIVCECGNAIHQTSMPIANNKPIFSQKEWQKLFSGLHQLGEIAKQNKIDLVYHSHMGTGVQTETEIHYLMQHTDPSLVSLLIDAGHIVFANGDPVSLITEYHQRIKHIHLKDLRESVLQQVQEEHLSFLEGVRAGVFTVAGDGFLDYSAIYSALAKYHYEGWMIVEAEQDPNSANPLFYAKKARKLIKEMIGL